MGADAEFNDIQFERKLTGLKDSQDSINACCVWCLENRLHHKKIVLTWLNVLKRVKVEQRLTLFYLANDVIQYSKRKSYDFVESWGTALQKATTMVREDKVKHKILRIFKIWEQRGVYGEEFITDLSGLISATPVKKVDETHEFQSTYLINKVRNCVKLEDETDKKLQILKHLSPKLKDADALISSLKDRAHVDDVEKEIDERVACTEHYVNSLKAEIKARNNLINLLLNAEAQLERDRKDVKVVAVAYKSFAGRVRGLKKKLDEKKLTLHSPIPSPDINAPSPSPDSDIDLPDNDTNDNTSKSFEFSTYTNAGFYNPVSTTTTENNTNSFMNNGFSSFMGSNMPFNIQNLNQSSLFNNSTDNAMNQSHTQPNDNNTFDSNTLASLIPSIIQPPPPPAPVPPVVPAPSYQYSGSPLAPPPLPPFTKNDSMYGGDSIYGEYGTNQSTTYGNGSYDNPQHSIAPDDPFQTSLNSSYDPTSYSTNVLSSFNQSDVPTYTPTAPAQPDQSYAAYDPYNPDEYNPEEEPETWENDGQWEQQECLDTPASPPPLEKEAYMEPIVYHDSHDVTGATDVDHRLLNLMAKKNMVADKKKDVDHRNLISLTGSPKLSSDTNWSKGDQDYRTDQDHRNSNMQKLHSPRKTQDNTESIDMELSDDEQAEIDEAETSQLLPPPPFPDDADANNFLDSLNEELSYDESAFFGDEENDTGGAVEDVGWKNNNVTVPLMEVPQQHVLLGNGPTPPSPYMNNNEMQRMDHFRGRGRGNRGHYGGNRGEFNSWGRGRGFRGGGNKFRGGWVDRGRGGWHNRGGPRGRGNFMPRGNFRGGYGNNF